MPSIRTVSSSSRIASTAAPSAFSFSPRPVQRDAAIAAYSVVRTSSSARLRSGFGVEGESLMARDPMENGARVARVTGYEDALAEGRARTLELVRQVAEDDLNRVHSPLMSPLVWDLGHIAAFEDLWLCVRAGGLEPLRPELMDVYDASETPRADRGSIPYLRRDDALEYMEAVRERALDVLARADFSPGSDRLNANGFVWDLLIQHEHQHDETMLQTLQIAARGNVRPGGGRGKPARAVGRRRRWADFGDIAAVFGPGCGAGDLRGRHGGDRGRGRRLRL